jgi:hypothetical protein
MKTFILTVIVAAGLIFPAQTAYAVDNETEEVIEEIVEPTPEPTVDPTPTPTPVITPTPRPIYTPPQEPKYVYLWNQYPYYVPPAYNTYINIPTGPNITNINNNNNNLNNLSSLNTTTLSEAGSQLDKEIIKLLLQMIMKDYGLTMEQAQGILLNRSGTVKQASSYGSPQPKKKKKKNNERGRYGAWR